MTMMAGATATSNEKLLPWCQQPLPFGFEAKYDPSTKRNFFVDHINHITTWEDPRANNWKYDHAQTEQNRRNCNTATGENLISSNFKHMDITHSHNDNGLYSKELIQMTELNPQINAHVDTDRNKFTETTVFIPKERNQIIRNCMLRFPEVYEENVVDSFDMFNGSLDEMSNFFTAEGFRDQLKETKIELKKLSPKVEDDVLTDIIFSCDYDYKESEIKLRQMGLLKSCSTASSKDIDKILNRVVSKYKSLSVPIVRMALESCEYDEDKCNAILSEQVKAKEPERLALSPKSKLQYKGHKKTSHEHEQSSSISNSQKISSDHSLFKDFSNAKNTPVNLASNHPDKVVAKRGLPITRQNLPREQAYNVQSQTCAIGPDKKLMQGPDTNSLNQFPSLACGPQPQLRIGPNGCYPVGPQFSMGQDKSLLIRQNNEKM